MNINGNILEFVKMMSNEGMDNRRILCMIISGCMKMTNMNFACARFTGVLPIMEYCFVAVNCSVLISNRPNILYGLPLTTLSNVCRGTISSIVEEKQNKDLSI